MSLLPCPFCGDRGDGLITQTHESGNHSLTYVQCNGCGARGPVCVLHHKALTAWNGRPREELLLHYSAPGSGPAQAGEGESLVAQPQPPSSPSQDRGHPYREKSWSDMAHVSDFAAMTHCPVCHKPTPVCEC